MESTGRVARLRYTPPVSNFVHHSYRFCCPVSGISSQSTFFPSRRPRQFLSIICSTNQTIWHSTSTELFPGCRISIFFDSLVAKVPNDWAPDRVSCSSLFGLTVIALDFSRRERELHWRVKLGSFEHFECSRRSLNSGRRVARQAQQIPIHGSIIDQTTMSTSVSMKVQSVAVSASLITGFSLQVRSGISSTRDT